MQRLYPGKLRDLCQMHLAFILDFSDSKLEMMLDDTATSCKKKLGLGSMFKPKGRLFILSTSNKTVIFFTF